jgi:hypothetical protein
LGFLPISVFGVGTDPATTPCCRRGDHSSAIRKRYLFPIAVSTVRMVVYYYCSCIHCDFVAIVDTSKEALAVFDEHPPEDGANHFVEVERLEQELSLG